MTDKKGKEWKLIGHDLFCAINSPDLKDLDKEEIAILCGYYEGDSDEPNKILTEEFNNQCLKSKQEGAGNLISFFFVFDDELYRQGNHEGWVYISKSSIENDDLYNISDWFDVNKDNVVKHFHCDKDDAESYIESLEFTEPMMAKYVYELWSIRNSSFDNPELDLEDLCSYWKLDPCDVHPNSDICFEEEHCG